MDVIQEILDWGCGLPKWQQAALQLIYERGPLSTADIEYLTALCKKEFGLAVTVADAPALTLAGSGVSVTGVSAVLMSVCETANTNALRNGESLTFAGDGLTIVFGDNGAGKSGYVRILKQACHARGAGESVRENIYEHSDTPAAATITFSVLGEDRRFRWTASSPPPRELADICVLDSKSAVVYANDEQPAVFLPFGLDLFPRLAGACDRVAEELERARNSEAGKRDPFHDVTSDTVVRTLLGAITAGHVMPRLRTLRMLTKDEKNQVGLLQQEIVQLKLDDPLKRAVELEQRSRRFGTVSSRLSQMREATNAEYASTITAARQALKAAESAASNVAADTFRHFPIQGLTDESWQLLWQAAVRFADEGAQPAHRFPPAAGQLCVLCQQPVADAAAERLASFQAFLKDETQNAVARAKKAVDDSLRLADTALDQQPPDATQLEELDAAIPDFGGTLRVVLVRLRSRADAIRSGAADIPPLPDTLEEVCTALNAQVSALTTQVAVLRSGLDPARQSAAQKELDELLSRLKLDEIWDRVEVDFARGQRITALETALKSARTTAVTNKGKKLLAEAVSQPLAERFNQVIADLKLKHVAIEIAPMRGSKGAAVHRIQLSSKPDVRTVEILSEGELRAIAIAGFLAEVQGQETTSTVVFDDPVSSLDFARREYVARALVAVAKQRPVVVFTHDPVFLWMLTTAADQADVGVCERQLRRVGHEAGIVSDTIGWSGRPAKQRIGPLRDRARHLNKVQHDDPGKYENMARELYRDLRDVWERGIEDCLFNGGLKRFDKRVQTLRLEKLHRVTEAQVSRMTAGMTKCSEYSHDQPADPGMAYPDPPEVQADVDECDAWMKELSEQYNRK